MTDFVKNKNYDDVFLRDLYLGVSFFFTDVLHITNVVNDVKVEVPVPVIPSFVGDEQFLKDFYGNRIDKICCGSKPAVLLNTYPSGRIIGFDTFSINDSVMMSSNVRTKREVDAGNMFVEQKELEYARNSILGLDVNFSVEFRCSTNIERWKLFQSLMDNFYKERGFNFSSCGIHKIPVSISITNSYKLATKPQFKFAEFDGFYALNVPFELTTFYIANNSLDRFKEKHRVDKPTVRTGLINNSLE